MRSRTWVLTLQCEDRPRVVASVTAALADVGGNIAESAQFWDRLTNRFFMRIAFQSSIHVGEAAVAAALAPIGAAFDMQLSLLDGERVPKIVIMVSRFDHCLLHLLYQIQVGWLRAEVAAVVSNHEDSRDVAANNGIPFHYWPVDKANRPGQEEMLLNLLSADQVDLLILARYMQVLSDQCSSRLRGRAINIHHSFLPSFKGARPYHQAHERGVKLIGATAHYVTPDLDEGPIIEQETERVTHAMSPEDFVAVGRDVESRVLARAVKLHLESRVLINGGKTIVFT